MMGAPPHSGGQLAEDFVGDVGHCAHLARIVHAHQAGAIQDGGGDGGGGGEQGFFFGRVSQEGFARGAGENGQVERG